MLPDEKKRENPMRRVSLSVLVLVALLAITACQSVSYIEANHEANLELLKTSAPYCADDAEFQFVNGIDEVRAEEIRAYFKANTELDLYEIAASGTSTWDKAFDIALFAAAIPHDNQKVQPEERNAIYLWEYSRKYPTGFNCRLHSIFLSELLNAAGIQNRFITCMSADPDDGDCHVVNIVWLPELSKWAMIDSDMTEYWTDENGTPLSLEEMRTCLINDAPHTINMFPGKVDNGFTDYLEAYWTKNLYYFACHTRHGFSLEGNGRTDEPDAYVALVPPDYQGPRDYADAYTTDAGKFWAAPVLSEEKVSREPFILFLAIDEDRYYSWDVLELPYFVDEKTLQIYAGEEVFVEIEHTGTQIDSMKVVSQNVNPEKTVSIKFVQRTDKENPKIHRIMTLIIDNPLDCNLNYECIMYELFSGKWYETDVIPVQPHLVSSEIWNDVIVSLVLQNFSLSDHF